MNERGDNPMGFDGGAAAEANSHIDAWAVAAVDYIEGTADAADRQMIDSHLAVCPECATALARQRETKSVLGRVQMATPPTQLEDRVLGELLFPSTAIIPPEPKPLPLRLRLASLWHRRFRAWMPATVAIVAVLVGIVVWGVANPRDTDGGQQVAKVSGTDITAAATAMDGDDPAAAAAAASTETDIAGAAPAASSVESASIEGVTTTDTATDGLSATTAVMANMASSLDAAGAGESQAIPTTVVERKQMVAALTDAPGPVYFGFTTTTVGGDNIVEVDTTAAAQSSGTVPASTPAQRKTTLNAADPGATPGDSERQWSREVASQITTFTELEPLPASLSPDGLMFAAYVDRENVSAFVDLLRSIASSLGIQVSLQYEPSPNIERTAALVGNHKTEVPVLVGHVIPQPATYRYGFTVSSLTQQSGKAGESGSDVVLPDAAGSHVLTVIHVGP